MAFERNIPVDKSHQTQVKVIVRNITQPQLLSSGGSPCPSVSTPERFRGLFLLAGIIVATPLWAQKDAGAIVGLVRDATGAVIADAKVTVVDVDRGTQLTLSTNHLGEYVASPLRIGSYSVTVEKKGFKKAVAGPVQVNIQDRVGVDLTLQPGMATEIVTVTAEHGASSKRKPPTWARW